MTNNRCVIIFIVCIATLLLCGCGNNSKSNNGKKPAESTPVSDLELYSDSEQDTAGIYIISKICPEEYIEYARDNFNRYYYSIDPKERASAQDIKLGTPFSFCNTDSDIFYFPVISDGIITHMLRVYKNSSGEYGAAIAKSFVQEINELAPEISKEQPLILMMENDTIAAYVNGKRTVFQEYPQGTIESKTYFLPEEFEKVFNAEDSEYITANISNVIYEYAGGSTDSDYTEQVPIKVLKYDYSDARGFSDRFEIRLFSNGSFQYLTSFTSSLIVSGMWDIKYGVLCLQDNSSERDTDAIYNIITNCLCIDGGKVTYLKDYSCGFLGIELEDGAEFKDTDPESGELTDVLFALQKDFGGGRHVNRNPFDYLEDDRSFLGEWICEKSEETVMISMADVQVGGYHFEIKKGDQRVGYGDAYNSDHKLIFTQAYYNDDIMDGVIVGTDNGLSFGFGVTGEDEKGTYVGDGVMELVWKSMSGSESSEPRRDSRRVIVKPETVEIDFTYAGVAGKMTGRII